MSTSTSSQNGPAKSGGSTSGTAPKATGAAAVIDPKGSVSDIGSESVGAAEAKVADSGAVAPVISPRDRALAELPEELKAEGITVNAGSGAVSAGSSISAVSTGVDLEVDAEYSEDINFLLKLPANFQLKIFASLGIKPSRLREAVGVFKSKSKSNFGMLRAKMKAEVPTVLTRDERLAAEYGEFIWDSIEVDGIRPATVAKEISLIEASEFGYKFQRGGEVAHFKYNEGDVRAYMKNRRAAVAAAEQSEKERLAVAAEVEKAARKRIADEAKAKAAGTSSK